MENRCVQFWNIEFCSIVNKERKCVAIPVIFAGEANHKVVEDKSEMIIDNSRMKSHIDTCIAYIISKQAPFFVDLP